jgi:hypothetical protein
MENLHSEGAFLKGVHASRSHSVHPVDELIERPSSHWTRCREKGCLGKEIGRKPPPINLRPRAPAESIEVAADQCLNCPEVIGPV